jgi:2-phosphosulfolactate phosphatase
VENWLAQEPYGIRLDWGADGANVLVQSVSCVVIVDVLSFTTAVTVATGIGTRVYPYPWRDDSAAEFARDRGAQLAIPSSPWTLSPAALLQAPAAAALVLPSPNGSAIAAAVGRLGGRAVVAACLRNAEAAGRWLGARGYGTPARPAAVIAAGEQWPGGTLRPALEDLLGAGAVIAAAARHGAGPLSPEAAAAPAVHAATPDVAAAVTACVSGQELLSRGFAADVAIAAAADASSVVPVLAGGAFTAESGAPENG